MAPAGYSKHLCVHCQLRRSVRVGDHIFARSFFTEDRRPNLPKAPACAECNGKKSALETYLTAVLPFGGMHADATRDLAAVQARLQKNRRLAAELKSGMAEVGEELTIPFDGERLKAYFSLVARGLLWHHGGRYLPSGYGVLVVTPLDSALDALLPILDLKGEAVEADLGGGTFRYRGVTANDDPHLTLWFFQIMGGSRMADTTVDETMSTIIAFTAPQAAIDRVAVVVGDHL